MSQEMLISIGPMVAVLVLFWHVALKLGRIESEMHEVREENRKLRSDLLALQTLMSVLVDSRRKTP
jgi:undecaprenyl pyrophosphate phosphatase UppP